MTMAEKTKARWEEWRKNGKADEVRARMSASHRDRWKKNRERYLKANREGADTRRGRSYRRRGWGSIYDQHGTKYRDVAEACEKLGLIERLVWLVLDGKRKSTGGYTFLRASWRYETDRRRWLAKGGPVARKRMRERMALTKERQ